MSVEDLIITEVMYNPGPGGFEFIEVTNTGSTAVSADDFFVGNSDFIPEYYQLSGIDGAGAPMIPAGATIVLVPSAPNFSGEVFVPPIPVSQADFEAVYGPLPAGAIYLNYNALMIDNGNGGLPGGLTYTIGGNDVFADSVFIPDGAAEGQSASIGSDGTVTFGAPTPGEVNGPPVGTPTIGDDTLVGTDGDDTISLLDGRDSYDGGLGEDVVFGGDGNDRIDGGRDNDLLDLGDGNDNAWGGQGDDELFGGTGLDRLNGNSGDDSIFGGKGGDILQGGKGEDYIEGGQGGDIINGGAQSDEIYGGTGDDSIIGAAGADTIDGGSGADSISGGNMDDLIYGGHGNDRITGGNDNDVLFGGKSNDVLIGGSGMDELYGDSGQDRLFGGAGDDILDGGAQRDRMVGGNGEDVLFGGRGNDVMIGGADADTFVFAGVVNHDQINDFEVGIDKIDLTAYGPVSVEEAMAAVSQTTDGALIDLKGNGSVLLQDVAVTDLTLDDFIFIPEIIEIG